MFSENNNSIKSIKKSNKIPRPLNSFMIFRLEKQREIVQKCPGANHRDISKIISKWWKELSLEGKESYINRAEKLKQEHKSLYPDYKFAPKRRSGAVRPYKKRPSNELIALNDENKRNLLDLYHYGSIIKGENKSTESTYQLNLNSPKTIDNFNPFNNNIKYDPLLYPSESIIDNIYTINDIELNYQNLSTQYNTNLFFMDPNLIYSQQIQDNRGLSPSYSPYSSVVSHSPNVLNNINNTSPQFSDDFTQTFVSSTTVPNLYNTIDYSNTLNYQDQILPFNSVFYNQSTTASPNYHLSFQPKKQNSTLNYPSNPPIHLLTQPFFI